MVSLGEYLDVIAGAVEDGNCHDETDEGRVELPTEVQEVGRDEGEQGVDELGGHEDGLRLERGGVVLLLALEESHRPTQSEHLLRCEVLLIPGHPAQRR